MTVAVLEHHNQGIDMACHMLGNMLHMVTPAQVCISEFLVQQRARWALTMLALSVNSILCIISKSLAMYSSLANIVSPGRSHSRGLVFPTVLLTDLLTILLTVLQIVLPTVLQSSPADLFLHVAPVSPTLQGLLCLQAANEALLKLLQVPKAVPQHAIPQQHQQHAVSQQQQQQQYQQQLQQVRPLQAASAQPTSSIASHGMPAQHSQPTSTAGTSQQLPFGALQLQQQRPQLQQQQQQTQQLLQQPHQQPPQATQLWQQPQTGSVSTAPGLPTGVSFLQASTSSLAPQAALASLAPLAVQVSAANLASISQPGLAALGNQLLDQSRTGGSLTQQMPVMALPASLVLSGVPVGSSQPAVSSAPAVCEGHRNA